MQKDTDRKEKPKEDKKCYEGACEVNVHQHCEEDKQHCFILQKKQETCTFEIYMTRCRLRETNWADQKAELMITGYANGRSAVIPGNGLWLVLHKKWEWRTINKLITRIEVKKDTQRSVTVFADVIECENWLGGKWEMGSGGPSFLNLQCGQQSGAVYVVVECKKPGGDITAKVEIEFMAFQVTP